MTVGQLMAITGAVYGRVRHQQVPGRAPDGTDLSDSRCGAWQPVAREPVGADAAGDVSPVDTSPWPSWIWLTTSSLWAAAILYSPAGEGE
jgi:hypothetical protein